MDHLPGHNDIIFEETLKNKDWDKDQAGHICDWDYLIMHTFCSPTPP
jgi:hypothetical protein